ncbi:diphosphomevalonate decarboxylase [Coxiella burnetii]|uniref:diphosphomevalonate decarboxylase n=1 Tax=Coxiella burnetii TaxID=777 RepID=UPI000183D0D5|nr:diphosphomevalonate decarboxylase [Coxiella burnetii]ACJ18701.1 diphosphomevalonate decarboxylase [Coxiella burnetii CbuG_Q212]ATN67080.1 dihydrofolate reductase [Coxiella burnetii]OYK85971.1 dihydrofolate reductase [Coxiella burnetii]
MRKQIFHQLLSQRSKSPQSSGHAFAPSNIALCKYWGKRNLELNLPVTSSLSISLGDKGATAAISPSSTNQHELIINNQPIAIHSTHAKQLLAFLEAFNFLGVKYHLELNFNIPLAAGLASSACAYAAIVKALDNFFEWQLDRKSLSILARLGSGSACRSVFNGFVEWYCGKDPDGMDSYAEPLVENWPGLCIGLCILNQKPKTVSSREGMRRTVTTSPLYSAWPEKANRDLTQLKKAIAKKDFNLLGRTAESNALAMHATMLAAWPPLLYSSPETITVMQKIWSLREAGTEIYFTQDAGPNIKLLFLESNKEKIKQSFPEIEIISPFKTSREQRVVLVDENDRRLGIEEKIKAHREGKLHRAFSVFIFSRKNNEWQLLLQQRHPEKYHSGGLWTNTCCSHPRPDEDIVTAGERRLFEETGLKIPLKRVGEFHYTATVGNQLIENEYDHVLIGFTDADAIDFNKKEISAVRWIRVSELKNELKENLSHFTPWFMQALEIAIKPL